MNKCFYDFIEKDINGNDVNFNIFKNKVVVIVNVASKCGNTKQYKDLEYLYEKYNSQGLEILGFPCNQFFFQEPKNNQEILEFCQTKYNVKFKMFSKIDVNGKNANDLYIFLKESKPWTPRAKNVKWNFEKFIIDKNGNVVDRIDNKTNPLEMEKLIIDLLNK